MHTLITYFKVFPKRSFYVLIAFLAAGIAEALVTTAVGLIIALSAVIPQSVFNRWSDEIELEMDEGTSELTEFILTHH